MALNSHYLPSYTVDVPRPSIKENLLGAEDFSTCSSVKHSVVRNVRMCLLCWVDDVMQGFNHQRSRIFQLGRVGLA